MARWQFVWQVLALAMTLDVAIMFLMKNEAGQPDHDPIGERIRSLLKSRGIKQANLAEISGLKPYEVSRIVRGKRAPTLQSLELIAKGLDMGLEELVSGTDAQEFLAEELQQVTRAVHEEVLTQLALAQSENEELREQADRHDGIVEGLREEVRAANAERDKANTRMAALERELRSALEQLRLERSEQESLRGELSGMQGQLTESREHVFRLQQTVQGQAGQVDALKRANLKLVESLAACQSSYNALRERAAMNSGTAAILAGVLGLGIGAIAASD